MRLGDLCESVVAMGWLVVRGGCCECVRVSERAMAVLRWALSRPLW